MDDDDRYVRITLRIPKELHVKLKISGQDIGGVNPEIIGRIQRSFEYDKDLKELLREVRVLVKAAKKG